MHSRVRATRHLSSAGCAVLLALLSATTVRAQATPEPAWRSRLVPWGPKASEPRPWREDPRLQGRNAPGFPDDFQVLFENPAGRDELMWVRVIAYDTATDLHLGILINEPMFLRSPLAGDNVVFRFEEGVGTPVALASPTHGDAGWPAGPATAFDSTLREGIRAFRVGNYGHNMPGIERCLEVLSPAMRDVPPEVPAFERFVGHVILGRCAAEKYETQLAIEQFRAAIALDSSNADAQLALLAEYSVMTHHRPGELSAEEERRWERAFLEQLALVRERFGKYPGVPEMMAMIFDPAGEAHVDSTWQPHMAKLRRVGYGVFRWKNP